MRATKIKMKSGCNISYNLLEIDSIYLTECKQDGFFTKAVLHDYVKANPGSIKVNIYPYPDLIPATSVNGEKYVRSSPDSTTVDNLLRLPRE
jgi:hypothetical protein